MNRFLSHFNEQGISVISYFTKGERELEPFFSYLANKSYHITDRLFTNIGFVTKRNIVTGIDDGIFNILSQLKDQNVFISIPSSEWEISNPSRASSNNAVMRANEMSYFVQKMCKISYDNNLAITILNVK